MPEDPTVEDVCRLARFRVLTPGPSAKWRSYSHMRGRVTGVTLASGGLEVTTEIRPRILYSLPAHVEPQPERRARARLAQLMVDRDAIRRQPRSEPAQALHMAAADREANARAAAARAGEAMIDVDGAPVPFRRVEHEGCWAAVADIGEEAVIIATRHVSTTEVALRTVLSD
jgi:hypothetical protein